MQRTPAVEKTVTAAPKRGTKVLHCLCAMHCYSRRPHNPMAITSWLGALAIVRCCLALGAPTTTAKAKGAIATPNTMAVNQRPLPTAAAVAPADTRHDPPLRPRGLAGTPRRSAHLMPTMAAVTPLGFSVII